MALLIRTSPDRTSQPAIAGCLSRGDVKDNYGLQPTCTKCILLNLFSVQPLCVLCGSVVVHLAKSTTKAQKLHREESARPTFVQSCFSRLGLQILAAEELTTRERRFRMRGDIGEQILEGTQQPLNGRWYK